MLKDSINKITELNDEDRKDISEFIKNTSEILSSIPEKESIVNIVSKYTEKVNQDDIGKIIRGRANKNKEVSIEKKMEQRESEIKRKRIEESKKKVAGK